MVLCPGKTTVSSSVAFLESRSTAGHNNRFLLDCIFSKETVNGRNNSSDENIPYPKLADQITFEWMQPLSFYGLRQNQSKGELMD